MPKRYYDTARMYIHSQPSMTLQEAVKPIYTPLGYTRERTEPRYWFNIQGLIVSYRGPELVNIGTLLSIFPDAEHWRVHYPRRKGKSIDTTVAAAALIKSCMQAGPYQPSR